MIKPLLQTVALVAAISLGALSTSILASPQNPWGKSEPAQASQPAKPEAKKAKAAKPVKDTKIVNNPGIKAHALDAAEARPGEVDQNKVADVGKTPEGKVLVARVVWVKGEFTASDGDSDEKRVLKANSQIYLHDTLETTKRGTAQIIFTDNASMTFRPKTVFFVNDYEYVPVKDKKGKKTDKKAGKYVMDLVTGGFRTVTGLVAKENPDNYKVNTPVATIGVRGTEYSLVYEKGGELFIQRYQGDPCISGSGEQTLCLNEKQRYGYVPDSKSAPAVVMAQPTIFRTDVQVVPVSFTRGTASVHRSTSSGGESTSGSSSSSGGSDSISPLSPAPQSAPSGGGGGSFCIQ